jgi:hypothetical protein
MKKFDTVIKKFNFKKFIIIYLVIAFITGAFTVGFLGIIFKDKLTFVYEYKRVIEKIEKNKSGIEAVKPELTVLAASSPDIADILILNNENNILFSANNSELAQNGSLELIGGKGNGFLCDKTNPDVYFRLVKNDNILSLKDLIGRDNKVEQDYNDEYFYENNFNAKEIYLLSYAADKSSGDKIYFISDIQPVANGDFYVKAAAALVMLFFMIYWVFTAFWVYADALKSKLNASIWGIITLFTNLAGLFVYLILRQGFQTCYKCGAAQPKTNVYCSCCGAKIGETCEKCNSIISGKDNYCKSCGSEINRK